LPEVLVDGGELQVLHDLGGSDGRVGEVGGILERFVAELPPEIFHDHVLDVTYPSAQPRVVQEIDDGPRWVGHGDPELATPRSNRRNVPVM